MTFIKESEVAVSEPTKNIQNILGTVANIRYYHQAAEWDSPLSFGVQAFIEYNGLVLNDRYQPDLIRVIKISGTDDAEVRDNRQPKPSGSGEYAYNAFYGGRNIILSGFIEAGNLAACETLKRNLKAAFASLEESNLKFRWFDIYDPFDDFNTILQYNPNASLSNVPSGNYSPIIGSLNNLKIENGLLLWKNASKVYFMRVSEKRTFCDVQTTIRCIVGEKDKSEIGFIICGKNSENYLLVNYKQEEETPKLNIEVVNNGVSTTLISEPLSFPSRANVGQSFWIRGKKEGNNIRLEYSLNELSNEALGEQSVIYSLTGEDEEIYGDKILSEVGIAGNQVNAKWAFDSFRIESLYPGDIQFKARKINMNIADVQEHLNKFKRPFQITMKTSDYRAFSSAQIVNILEPSNFTNNPILGRSYPRLYPLSYRKITTSLSAESNLISINNRGSVYVEPVLYLYGQGENILIKNLTNGQTLEWLGYVSEGDYVAFDCKEETVENSLGANFSEPLVPTTEWIRLEPMWNDIYIQGSKFLEGTTKLVIKFHHGYM